MSTRCQVSVYVNGARTKLYYHHHDGYPEYMGEFLKRAAAVAFYMGMDTKGDADAFCKVLGVEGGFEDEPLDYVYGDIEFAWHVEFSDTEKPKVSYVAIDYSVACKFEGYIKRTLSLISCLPEELVVFSQEA